MSLWDPPENLWDRFVRLSEITVAGDVVASHMLIDAVSALLDDFDRRREQAVSSYQIKHDLSPPPIVSQPTRGSVFFDPEWPLRVYVLTESNGRFAAQQIGAADTHLGWCATPEDAVDGLKPLRGVVEIRWVGR